jgi:mono/diheme cytochrome c family protein
MRKWIAGTLLLAAAGCGDPKTNDARGYTKAPLEQPTVLVKGEPKSRMDELGNPILPEAPVYKAETPADTQKTAGGTTGGGAPQAQVPEGATAADVEEGKKMFGSSGNCYTCHGPTAGGTALAPALNDSQWINIDGSYASIQGIIDKGVPQPKQHPAPMPAKGGAPLTAAQVKQVAAYVYSISR